MLRSGEDLVDGLAQDLLARAVRVPVEFHQDRPQVHVPNACHGGCLGAEYAVAQTGTKDRSQ